MAKWKVGKIAGQYFTGPDGDGDLVVSRHVSTPNGEPRIMIEVIGFRGEGDKSERVVLDRYIQQPPGKVM
jgi:hypothetical protein